MNRRHAHQAHGVSRCLDTREKIIVNQYKRLLPRLAWFHIRERQGAAADIAAFEVGAGTVYGEYRHGSHGY